MATKNELISLIIPIHNEEANISWHHKKVLSYLSKFNYSFEIIYVDDGSSDNSLKLLSDIKVKNKNVKVIKLSRNFGKEAATSAGLNHCHGTAALIMDGDGQHPIEVIDSFIEKWSKGADVVVGVRHSNKGEGFIKKYGSILFYKILNILTNDKTTPSSTDFRLIDRKVINEFNKLTERTRITRGLIDWLGFKREFVYFDALERKDGKASYSTKKLVKLAVDAFVSNSTKPLKIVGVLGLLVTSLSALLSVFILIEMYALNDPLKLAVTGSAFLALFISFLVGVVLTCQGLLALYIESIHSETQNRPLYVIAEMN